VIVDLRPGMYLYANVTVLDAYDGDTVYLDIDKGFHDWRLSRLGGSHPLSYRLLDIDAPELRPLVTRQAATEARDYLLALILSTPVLVATYRYTDTDNFGRYLVHIWLQDGTDVNRQMIESGHAVDYPGPKGTP